MAIPPKKVPVPAGGDHCENVQPAGAEENSSFRNGLNTKAPLPSMTTLVSGPVVSGSKINISVICNTWRRSCNET